MTARIEALEKVKRKIEDAYLQRNDYPPFELTPFADRPKYHHYIIKLLREEIDYEIGCKKEKVEIGARCLHFPTKGGEGSAEVLPSPSQEPKEEKGRVK